MVSLLRRRILRFGHKLGLALAAALVAAAPAAAEELDAALAELDWQAADGSFPDHGGCTYLEPLGGISDFRTAADDFEAMRQRTRVTNQALAMIPQPRRADIVARAVEETEGEDPPAVECSGIDSCIEQTAEAAGVPLAVLTTDLEFLRRVSLDLTGRIPTTEKVFSFKFDTAADKRAQLVEELLATPEWADRWAMFFGDLYRNTRFTAQVNRYPDARDSFHLFLLESMQQNKPYDQMAREMLAAEGTSDGRTYPDRYTDYAHYSRTYLNYNGNPVKASAVGYIVGGRTIGGPIQDTYDTLAFLTARDFLGISMMDCVLCHDGAGHLDGLNDWGTAALRYDGWSLAAFFSDIQRYQSWRVPGNTLPTNPNNNRRVNANYYFIHDLPTGQTQVRGGDTAGEYKAQTAGGNRPDRINDELYVAPSYPLNQSATPVDGTLRLREQLGLHLTQDPQFARAAANYIWSEFFSRGIVEPADQFDLVRLDPASPPEGELGIQPSHPRLLQLLADGFRDSGFDLKWLMGEIVNSNAYQRSSRYEGVFNPLYEEYFVRHQVKRLTAEQIHDALVVAADPSVLDDAAPPGRHPTYNVSRYIRNKSFAMQFPDVVGMPTGNNRFQVAARQLLEAFTPGDREETPRSGEGSPLQALSLMNNSLVLDLIDPDGRPGTITDELKLADDALVSRLFLKVLGRYPTASERTLAVNHLAEGDRAERASDLMWVLFNKTDFYFNY